MKQEGRSPGRSASADGQAARAVGLRRVLGAAVFGLLLAGCSRVPDAVNPIEWYKGAAGLFSGEEAETASAPATEGPAADRSKPPPGADRPFPALSEVPARPSASTTSERKQVAEGLVADREAARYSADVVRRQSQVVNPLPPPGTAMASSTPAPPAPASPPPAPPAAQVAAVPPAPAPAPAPPAPAAAQPMPPVPEPASAPPPPPAMSSPSPAAASASPPAPSPAAAPLPPVASRQPAPVAAARPAAPAPTSVEDTFRARLAQQQQLPAEAARNSLDAAGGFGSSAAAAQETVVVSSEGTRSATGSLGAPAASVAPAPANDAEAPSDGAVKVATIVFNDGSSRLGSVDRRILRDVLAIHRERGGRLHIVGHASSRTRAMDPTRHNRVNQEMSAARADAIAKALVAMGVPRNAISVVARADADPMYYEVMPTGEAGNRRAEIYIDS